MRFILINIIALVIAVTSFHVTLVSALDFNPENVDAISSLPILDLDPIRNPSTKHSSEIEIITNDVIHPAIIAVSLPLKLASFLYYLPIYSLYRAKSYFLLI